MATKAYLTEEQAISIISGATNAAQTHTRAEVTVYMDGATAMVNVKEGDFGGWLATLRDPSQPREFKTLQAAVKTAAKVKARGMGKTLEYGDGVTIEVHVGTTFMEMETWADKAQRLQRKAA